MLADWEKFERESENSFHVRGLSGSVAIALEAIKDDPHALVMVVAGALSSQTPIHWDCFGKDLHGMISTKRGAPYCQGPLSKSTRTGELFLINTYDSLLGKSNFQVAVCAKLENLGLVWDRKQLGSCAHALACTDVCLSKHDEPVFVLTPPFTGC